MKQKNKRIKWDEFWFLQAIIYSTRGTCNRLKTACIIVKNNRLVGAGYNGAPSQLPHCDSVGHLIINNHCERTLHAEENAIINTERINLKGATAYILGTPCLRCTRLLINSGIKKIYHLGKYHNSLGKEYIKEMTQKSKVELKEFKIKPENLIKKALDTLKQTGGILNKIDFHY